MNVNKLHLLLITVVLSSSTLYSQSPNVLLIIADDLGVDACNGYNLGAINPTTPHLDSLQDNGLLFKNAWSSPVCTPTRAGMMSGKYGSKNGVKTAPGNLDTAHTSIFKSLKQIDPNYTTAAIGKWHISKPINAQHPTWHSSDHYMGILGAGWPAYDNWDKTENGVTTNSADYATSYFTDNAINWIDNQTQPWFLWLAHIAPHTPFHVPPAYMHSQPSTNSQLKKYLAMIESLDYEVGRLLDALSPSEKANTTIIFIGDNGTPNNVLQDYPTNRGKETLYQGGVHVPFFISGYGVNRIGEEETALINVIDIYATVMELAGDTLPGGKYNSLSFKHLLSPGSTAATRQYNYTELDTNGQDITTQGFAIRNSEYKLIEYHDGQQEMFNIIADSLELTNLLLGTLTAQEQNSKSDLEAEALQRQTAWSCKDGIQNGNETGIDCGGTYCAPCLTSINKNYTSKNIYVFPNPSKDLLTITSNDEDIKNIKVFNTLGELVLSKEMINSNSTTLNISLLKTNIYYLHINTPSNTEVRKINLH